MTNSAVTGTLLEIERLGQRGEGVVHGERGMIYVPYALPGDVARVEVAGERGRLLEVVSPSPDRIPAFCEYYGECGGCAVQAIPCDLHGAAPPLALWPSLIASPGACFGSGRLRTDQVLS